MYEPIYEIVNRLGPVAQELLAAWSRLPAKDCVPDRKSFDPMSIVRILPIVSLLQRTGQHEWRFRLVGTEIERRWRRRFTGLNYIEAVSPQAGVIMLHEFNSVVGCPCGSLAMRHVQFDSGRIETYETLRLPLRADDGSVSLILSCSGELHDRTAVIDRLREIVTIPEQQFFDIGAGCPDRGALAQAGAPRSDH
ncbi:MAG TPA: PAS domain-containing protein [Stellaceae bacterium]|nr:PAS domain-containing protein [Stellaceae bacterium]